MGTTKTELAINAINDIEFTSKHWDKIRDIREWSNLLAEKYIPDNYQDGDVITIDKNEYYKILGMLLKIEYYMSRSSKLSIDLEFRQIKQLSHVGKHGTIFIKGND